VNSYQSRVGPLKWIGPSTDAEIERAGSTKTPVIIVPIAFVSEHSETLVELDIEYKELAHEKGVPYYGRVGTVMAEAKFIDGLAAQVRTMMGGTRTLCSALNPSGGGRICPRQFTNCPHKEAA
jgi:ferrochelatase